MTWIGTHVGASVIIVAVPAHGRGDGSGRTEFVWLPLFNHENNRTAGMLTTTYGL